jgi:hypothetical protein
MGVVAAASAAVMLGYAVVFTPVQSTRMAARAARLRVNPEITAIRNRIRAIPLSHMDTVLLRRLLFPCDTEVAGGRENPALQTRVVVKRCPGECAVSGGRGEQSQVRALRAGSNAGRRSLQRPHL